MEQPGAWSQDFCIALNGWTVERFKGRARLLSTIEASGVRDAITKLNQGAIQVSENHCVVWSASSSAYCLLYRRPLTSETALKQIKDTDGYTSGAIQQVCPPPAYQRPSAAATEIEVEITIKGVELVRIFQTFGKRQDLFAELKRSSDEGVLPTLIGKTQTKKGCEKTATWDEPFEIIPPFKGFLTITVYKANLLANNVLCGEALLNLDRQQIETTEKTVELFKKGEKTGDLSIAFRSSASATSSSHASAPRRRTVKPDKQRLERLLNRPSELERKLKDIFKMYATSINGSEKRFLRIEDVQEMIETLAMELGKGADAFASVGNLDDMFWKYNSHDDAILDEEPAVMLMTGIIMRYRDAEAPDKKNELEAEYKEVEASYDLGRELGRGGQAIVHIASQKATGREVVLKQYAKGDPDMPAEEITNEFTMLIKLKHPKIARYYEIFQDATNFYIVSEPYFGGDLTSVIKNATEAKVQVTESWLAKVIVQIAEGVDFLHNHSIIHCDLKEANVMVANKENLEEPQVLVIDFGLANTLSSTSVACGSPGYMPPEVWTRGLWTPRGDVFSLGCIIFTMVMGKNPFLQNCRSLQDVQTMTMTIEPSMDFGSADMRNLLHQMLHKDFKTRPAMRRVLESAWLSRSAATRNAEVDLSVLDKLAHQTRQTELRRALLMEVASKENLAQLTELNKLFVLLDKNNDGCLSEAEMRNALTQSGWKPEDTEKLLHCLDNGKGEVPYEEFMVNLMGSMINQEGALLDRIFREADTKGQGTLDVNDIEKLLTRPLIVKVLGKRDAAKLLKAMDANGDGVVSLEEFKAVMQGVPLEDSGSTHLSGKAPPFSSLLLTRRVRPTGRYMGFSVNDPIEYYSESFKSWMVGTITQVDLEKGVTVSMKPMVWIQGQEVADKIRKKQGDLSTVQEK